MSPHTRRRVIIVIIILVFVMEKKLQNKEWRDDTQGNKTTRKVIERQYNEDNTDSFEEKM